MRPKSTDPGRAEQKRDTIRGAALSACLRLLGAAVLLWLRARTALKWLDTLLLIAAAGELITVPCGLIVLRQRLREIDRGELDEARKY